MLIADWSVERLDPDMTPPGMSLSLDVISAIYRQRKIKDTTNIYY